MLPRIDPMPLVLQKEPFDDPEWLFELKYDGFRAVAYIENGKCRLVSRNNNVFERFKRLHIALAKLIDKDVILDGEIACLDDAGKGKPCYLAFDLLYLDGQDLRDTDLVERKSLLRDLIKDTQSLRYIDHIDQHGIDFYNKVCDWDLEGVVAKPRMSKYRTIGKSKWIKIKNPAYSQAEGRQELFNKAL